MKTLPAFLVAITLASFPVYSGVDEDIKKLNKVANNCGAKKSTSCALTRLTRALALLHLKPPTVYDSSGVEVGKPAVGTIDADVVAVREIEGQEFFIQIDSTNGLVLMEIPTNVGWTGINCTGTPYLQVLADGVPISDKAMTLRPATNDVVFTLVDPGTPVIPGHTVALESRHSPVTGQCDNNPTQSPFPNLQLLRIVEIVPNTLFPLPFETIEGGALVEDGREVGY